MPSSAGMSRSEGTRSAARAHLRALREERMQRRRGKAVAAQDPQDSAEQGVPDQPIAEPELIAQDTEAETFSADASEVQQSTFDSNDPIDASSEDPEQEEDIDANEADPLADDMEYEMEADEDPEAEAPGEAAADEALVEDADCNTKATSDATEQSDQQEEDNHPLSALPGAGPGLIWMLERVGVTSVDGLANTDPEKLSNALGLVGELLDVEYCVNWARDLQHTQDTMPQAACDQ